MRTTRRIADSHVAISEHPLEGEAIKQGWRQLPLKELIRPNDTVVITPNWVKDEAPESGTIVGPGSLQEIIRIVQGYQPNRIVVACGSGGSETSDVLQDQGFQQMLTKLGVEFIDLNYGPFIDLALQGCLPQVTPINQILGEMDVLISYTQIKQHEEATVSLGIKNIALSFPPASVHGFPKKELGIHHNLHDFIAAMGKAIPIDLTILSGSQGMVGTGPSGGKPVNSGLMIIGTDPVATDAVGARLLGFMPQAVHYLWLLIQKGVGQGDLSKVNLAGIPLSQAEEIFSQAAHSYPIQIDQKNIRGVHI